MEEGRKKDDAYGVHTVCNTTAVVYPKLAYELRMMADDGVRSPFSEFRTQARRAVAVVGILLIYLFIIYMNGT